MMRWITASDFGTTPAVFQSDKGGVVENGIYGPSEIYKSGIKAPQGKFRELAAHFPESVGFFQNS